MSLVTLPCRTDLPRYFFSIELENVTYIIHFEWNDRAGKWFMDINDQDDQPLITGLALVLGALPVSPYHHMTGVPPGEFMVVDTTGNDVEAGFSDLGERVVLVYNESVT